MNTIDTRNLIETRDELKQEILDSFLENFPHYEEMTESFEDILFEEEEIESWKQDWQEEINQITCIDELEEEISEFSFGETLIPEDDFTEYCKDMVEDYLYNVPDFIKDNINWDGVASDLEVDYSSVTYQGESYLVRV